MKNKIIAIIFISFFASSTVHTSYAGDSLTYKYPDAVLVELKTGQSRLNALRTDKKYKQLDEAKIAVAGANDAMIRDFKDHFNYCPVYYFADTNQKFILKKEFDGILSDADGTTAVNTTINAASKDYVIVYYGYPTEQKRNQKVITDSTRYASTAGEPMGKGLIITNDKMQQIAYLYNMGYDALYMRSMRKDQKIYAYSSKHFNIDYFPFADDFNKKLKKRKNPHQMKMNRRRSD